MPRPDPIAPGIARLRAANPSPMTGEGTNTYLVGEDSVAVIDPGPAAPAHLDAIEEALKGRVLSHILVTHAHLDHSALAPELARRHGAPVLAFGDAEAGRAPHMAALAGIGGGEGVDTGFAPDLTLADGDVVRGQGWEIEALHTPGHMGGHLSFLLGGVAFSGDHVMGWASSLVSPPDGDMGAYVASLHRLRARAPKRLLPGHGAPVEDPAARIDWLIAHRAGREAQIRAALVRGEADAARIARAIYRDIPQVLMPAAERSVLAHLVDLERKGEVETDDAPGPAAIFRSV
ncbi:MBL fold metallo-hydrolase [Palleronia sediminis]|uniref:MBL fold metallo-hydrolase n=1 Tax=Palleronia sediminis TaxID=2547833 RepID=A0A4R6A5K1_9RHOB|nr:MBL fold metallo-hydrolase [Palleronia sediminis]TDL78125.1 MBL fold metallo-hydrolase [Palleronia sediminis]